MAGPEPSPQEFAAEMTRRKPPKDQDRRRTIKLRQNIVAMPAADRVAALRKAGVWGRAEHG